MLAAMFSGRGFKMETDDTGAYFIDRDGTHFRHILNFLRGAFDIKTLSKHEKQQLVVEANFYALSKLEEILRPKPKFEATIASANGILHWIGTAKGEEVYKNPHPEFVTVTASDSSCSLAAFVARDVSSCQAGGWCTDARNKWVMVDLALSVMATHYRLTYSTTCHRPRYWRLEGSIDGQTFILLDDHNTPMNSDQELFPISAGGQTTPLRYIRLTCTGHDASHGGCYCFHVGGLELFGEVNG